MCRRWVNSFAAFLKDLGLRPEGMTLDRKNPDKNYAPTNCRWADATTQTNNRRKQPYVKLRAYRRAASILMKQKVNCTPLVTTVTHNGASDHEHELLERKGDI